MKKYEHLIIPDIQWVDSLPDHEVRRRKRIPCAHEWRLSS